MTAATDLLRSAASADVVAVLRQHLPRDRYDDEGIPADTYCSCGQWEGDYFADGDAGPFDDHLADALLAAFEMTRRTT